MLVSNVNYSFSNMNYKYFRLKTHNFHRSTSVMVSILLLLHNSVPDLCSVMHSKKNVKLSHVPEILICAISINKILFWMLQITVFATEWKRSPKIFAQTLQAMFQGGKGSRISIGLYCRKENLSITSIFQCYIHLNILRHGEE